MKTFPVLDDEIKSVPWRLVADADTQAQRNHNQSLVQLARRGGLSVFELYYVLRGEQYSFRSEVTPLVARRYLKKRLVLLGERQQ